MFSLAIFCLIASSLSWFMYLTSQVPMQYCSLQHRNLLPSPVTSTTGRCFHFGSVSSVFLELFYTLSLHDALPIWFLSNIVLYSIRLYFHHQSHLKLSIVFTLAPSLHSFWSYSPLFSNSILGIYWPGEFIFHCHIFAFSYCSWGSQGKNTEVVCHSHLQWTTFYQNSPSWPIHLGWP